MTERASGTMALLRLMTWLSPVFPIGGFSYSHGLERAVHDGLIHDRASLQDWLWQLLAFGSAWNDAVLFAESWRRAAAGSDLTEIAELTEALAGSAERHRESMLQGAAFLKAATTWPHSVLDRLPAECPYCVAVGAYSGGHGIALEDCVSAFLLAFTSNLVQAAIRLGVIGQTGGLETVAALEPHVMATAKKALRSTLDDLGSSAIMSEICAMKHETQYSRLFRS